jgi:hypothetical protein
MPTYYRIQKKRSIVDVIKRNSGYIDGVNNLTWDRTQHNGTIGYNKCPPYNSCTVFKIGCL